jgi:hypothetical protein
MNNMPEFDPIKLMMSKRNSGDVSSDSPIVTYNEEDVLALEEFCKTHNIMGVNFKNRNPKSILHMLKQRIGILDEQKIEKKLLFD